MDSFEDLDVEEDREESCVLKLLEDNEFVVEAVCGLFDDLRVRILLWICCGDPRKSTVIGLHLAFIGG